jgi:hypothetical protein
METKDWREDFYEVRVYASKPIEFTVTVKANDEDDAVKEASRLLDKMTNDTIVAHDNYNEKIEYDSDEWNVIGIEEAFGFENTPEDLIEANKVAENVEDSA